MHPLNTIRNLRFRYIVGLSVIALLVSTSFFAMTQVVSRQRGYSSLVNLAGHQSGLANRIAYFAGLMVITDDEMEYNMARAQVGRTINKMKAAHIALRMGDPEKGIPHVTNENLELIYTDPMVGLDLVLNRFLERAHKVYEYDMEALTINSIDYQYITTYGPHVIEPMFDAAVDEYEKIGRAAIFKIEKLELLVWLATLATLILEVIFIFRPMERQVSQTIETLETSIKELTKTRQRLLAAQELAKVGDWELRVDSGHIIWSDQIYQITGISPDDFTPDVESALELVHPEDRDMVRSRLMSLTKSKEILDIEHRIIRPDGGELVISQHVAAMAGKSNRIETLSGTMQDITKRKLVEIELERSKSLLEATLESTADGILVVDLNGQWSGFNQKFIDIWSIPESISRIGNDKAAQDFLLDKVADRETYIEKVQDLYRDQEAVSFDEIALLDGRTLIRHSQPQYLGKKIVGRVWTFRDVTAQKLIEVELRDSEEFHKELFEMSPVAMYLQDFTDVAEYVSELRKHGVLDLQAYLSDHKNELQHLVSLVKLDQANKAAVETYKAESSEKLIQSFSKQIDLNQAQHFIDQVVDFTSGKDWYEGEAVNFDHEGNIITIIVHKAVINREANGLAKILVSVVDITDLRKALTDKTELETRLQQVQKMESLGTLAGGIAHDFNNILGAILGYSELAKMSSAENPNALKYMDQLCVASERAKGLVQQILAFSRQSRSEMLPVDIGITIKEVLKLLRASMPSTIYIC